MPARDALSEVDPFQRSKKREQTEPYKGSSGSGFGMFALLIAAVIIFLAMFAPAFELKIPTESQVMIMVFGLVLFVIGAVTLVITRLYHRAPSDMAFVRTGMGGPKAILDGGALVIPVVHEIRWVSLRTMRFEVTRSGKDALITQDNLRTDITAEFFIKVKKEEESVKDAATSFGAQAIDPGGIQEVVDKKLESALRQVAAEMELQQLLVNRADFISSVSNHVALDIQNNGLVLENVTISMLDQTSTAALRPEDNIFDAQGRRKIIEITTAQNVESNRLQLEAQQQIKAKQVETDQFIFGQDVTRATAEANRDKQITVAQAENRQESTTKAAELDRQARTAEVERDKAVQLAQVAQAQAVDVAQQERDQAVKKAEILKGQTVAVTERELEIAVALKEKERAEAQAAQLAAEAEKAKQEQNVQTVQVTATAEREKQRAIINAEAEAGQKRVDQNTQADIAAYNVTRQATARQEAADKEAQARIIQAEADKKAKALTAEGDQALALVPVNVSRQQVEVNKAQSMIPVEVGQRQVEVNAAQVEVDRKLLEYKNQYQAIARELEIALAQIAANRDVQVEQAKAVGVALSSSHMTVYGDPATVTQMFRSLTQGQQVGRLVEGVAASIPDEVKGPLADFAAAVQQKFGLTGVSETQLLDGIKNLDSKTAATLGAILKQVFESPAKES